MDHSAEAQGLAPCMNRRHPHAATVSGGQRCLAHMQRRASQHQQRNCLLHGLLCLMLCLSRVDSMLEDPAEPAMHPHQGRGDRQAPCAALSRTAARAPPPRAPPAARCVSVGPVARQSRFRARHWHIMCFDCRPDESDSRRTCVGHAPHSGTLPAVEPTNKKGVLALAQ